ncbi:MAG: hypothetical protein GX270_11940 [Clostridiaceae bacterium]|jgi:nitrogen regulatory protein PII|nr:hypothetical protein [Clostridiaceae bacterium]
MENNSDNKLNALITIMDYDLRNDLKNLFNTNNMPTFFLTHGYGSAESAIFDILGYGGSKKIVSLGIHTKTMSNYIMNKIHDNIDLNKPGTGIAFTINLSSVSSVLSTICKQACKEPDDNLKIGSEYMSAISKDPYHLIITIVNSGYFDQVMEAAKGAGATGGTVVHARGLGSKEAMKYLGITIQPEKDLVLILTPKDKKLAIMESIMHEVGINTPGMGICFSMPVDSTLGIGTGIDSINEP